MVAMLLIGTTNVWAQEFTGRIEQYPASDYATKNITFKLSDIATALETDTTTLAADLDAWYEGKDTVNNYLTLVQADDTKSIDYTQGSPGGFWMNSEGTARAWTDGGLTWYNTIWWDTAEDVFAFAVGQYPDTLAVGNATNAKMELTYNNKTVTFNIGIDVIARPTVDLMADTIAMSAIEVVAEHNITMTQYPKTGWDATNFSVDLTESFGKLGDANIDAVAANMGKMLYAQFLAVQDGTTMTIDSLRNTSTATPEPGWWFSPEYNEGTGEYTNVCQTSGYDGSINRFYLASLALDPATKEFTGGIGQYPGNLTPSDEPLTASFYLVHQGKAIKFNIALTIEEKPVVSFDNMTEAGSKVYDIELFPNVDGTYLLDIPAMETALGCAADEWTWQALAAENSITSDFTANGGYWMNRDGYVCSWGQSHALYTEPGDGDSIVKIGFNTSTVTYKAGDVQPFTHYYTFGEKYYKIQVNVTFIEKPALELEIAAREGLNVYIKPDASNYTTDAMKTTLDSELITNAIGAAGATGYTLYAITKPIAATDSTEAVPSAMTDQYSCDPNPGFWMTAEEEAAENGNNAFRGTWGTNSFGMTYANNIFTWYQIPGQRSAGDEYWATFYLVNSATNKAIQYDVHVLYTDEEIKEAVVVGSEDVILINDPLDQINKEINLQTAADSLGIDDPALFGSAELKVLKTSTSYTGSNDLYDDAMGWYLNANGHYISAEKNPEEAAIAPINLGYDWDYASVDGFALWTFSGTGQGLADGTIIRTKVALEYDSKQYVFNIQIMNEVTATGIQNVAADAKADGNVYDIAGRIVRKNATSVDGLANGIYIFNGKKYIVK